jgi:hypothetical protein
LKSLQFSRNTGKSLEFPLCPYEYTAFWAML